MIVEMFEFHGLLLLFRTEAAETRQLGFGQFVGPGPAKYVALVSCEAIVHEGNHLFA